MKVLVVGCGNPLRADDGVGPRVVQAFENRSEIDCLQVMQLTPELAEAFSRAELVIVIDASARETPGAIDCRQVFPAADAGSFTHHMTLERLLATARDLYGKAPQTFLITVGAVDYAYRESLSPQIEAAAVRAVRLVEVLIDDYLPVANSRSAV